MIYVWIIEDKLAQGPFPNYSMLSDYSKLFNAFVVLVMPHEIPGGPEYYLGLLNSYGLEVYYAPTPDFHPVDLLVLHDISLFIDNVLERSGKVYVHCLGGIGRSGTVTSAYLIYLGKSLFDAVNTVRSKVAGAVEVFGQWKILEDYYALYNNVDKSILNTLLKLYKNLVGETGLRHVSKIIQLSIELAEALGIDIEFSDLVITSFLYGIMYEDKNIVRLVKEYLGKKISEKTIDNAKMLLENVLVDNTRLSYLSEQALLLYLARILDYYRDQRVVVTDYSSVGDKILITLYCDYDCSKLIEITRPIMGEFEKRKGRRISLVEQSYLESI